MFEFGDKIQFGSVGYPVQGERPEWLKDYDRKIVVTWKGGSETHPQFLVSFPNWQDITAFAVEKDCWAYAPIRAGFTPWAGGEQAPDDWDGGDTLMRCGDILPVNRIYSWSRYDGAAMPSDIIGYKRTTAGTSNTYDHLRRLLDRMISRTGAEIEPGDDCNRLVQQIDYIVSAMLTVPRAGDWHAPEALPDVALHIPTVQACIDALPYPGSNRHYVEALKTLLPPDPLETRARELHAAARGARSETKPMETPGTPDILAWDDLSPALRKFWIAMARIDTERSDG